MGAPRVDEPFNDFNRMGNHEMTKLRMLGSTGLFPTMASTASGMLAAAPRNRRHCMFTDVALTHRSLEHTGAAGRHTAKGLTLSTDTGQAAPTALNRSPAMPHTRTLGENGLRQAMTGDPRGSVTSAGARMMPGKTVGGLTRIGQDFDEIDNGNRLRPIRDIMAGLNQLGAGRPLELAAA